ncbi:hypothetical protein QTP70_025316, partial [Hemibagrus guttatus]
AEEGNIEYKCQVSFPQLKLVNPTQYRFEHLATQLKWRLQEGRGEAVYQIGVEDNGLLVGLTDNDMKASINTLRRMAERVGADITLLREREVDYESDKPRRIAEVLVRKVPDNQQFLDLRVAVLGNVDSGKSTLLGVLTQGELDNGRGRARLNLFRHLHEIQTGRTSSISFEILGFNSKGEVVNYSESRTAEEICESSSKMITFIDLAGHHKYLKTTIFGLTSYCPDFAMLVVGANTGIAGTTREHLGLALALKVPVFVVVSKVDVCVGSAVQKTVRQLERLLKLPGCNKVPMLISNRDDAVTAAQRFAQSSSITPIFTLSSVSGENLDLLKVFFNILPPLSNSKEQEELMQQLTEMTLMVCKKKRSKIEKKTKWWKLKKEECCEEFRQKLRQALGGQVVLPDDWETTAEVIRETGRKVLGVSSGRRKEDKETWWWNEEVQDSIQRKRLAKKKWDMDRTEENRQEYKELQRRVKREVSKAKQKAYDELYTRLDTREGEKDLYRLARQRDRDGKDVQQVRVIKDRDGRVLTSEESVQRRWKEYFEELMNEENEREKRVEGVNSVEQKVDKIRKDEVRNALKRMKSGKAVGPDDIPVEVWKCLGEAAVEFLASLFNRVLESERMPEEWRRSVLVPIFKNKGDVQSCSNYRGIKLMSHTMKLWERVVEARLRKVVEICEQQYGFMPRKSTTDAIFALRILMEKYRDGQRELYCVFVDLEKAYDRVPREELWYCMRKSGVAEKYVRVVQDMYERSRTVVRCAVGQTEEFKVEVGLHQGSVLSPFLFAIVIDQLSQEVRQESPWTMMFADDIVICSESREQVEENLERWRFALERRGMKVSRSKTEYMCVNEREGSGTVRLQGEEVKKVQEFKYLGSTVQSNGECGKEVKKRVQAGWNGWRKVSGVLCDRKISARIKGKVYRTVVRPAMLYGLETVSLRKRQESELEVAELKMLSGVCREGDRLVVGPTDDGKFLRLKVCSMQRNRSACRVLRAGQAATLALGNFDRSLLRKGMVMVSPKMNPTICWQFEAAIVLLFHAKTFRSGFQVTVHVGNIRQTATVECLLGKEELRTGERAVVCFRFLKHPEYLRIGAKLLFREGVTKGIGHVTHLVPSGQNSAHDQNYKPHQNHN